MMRAFRDARRSQHAGKVSAVHIDIIENLPPLARVEDDWIVLETKSGRNLGGRIDPRCIPDLLQQATELHRKGQSADAEIGYRRILEVEPKHADALHRLGQLLAAKGDFAAAKRMFRILTTVRPDAAKAWQCLGQVCESLGQHEEALRQHLEFMRLQPDLPDSFVAVGRCMVKLGRMAEINAALLAAIEPASAPSVRKWRDWRPTPDRQTAGEHSASA
jgi:tetratricopeptide (TPR) repeat protein